MRRRNLLIAIAAFVALAAVLWVPWATKKRGVVASTPVPAALFGVTPAPLKPGQKACMDQVTFDQRSQVAEIGVATGGKPGPPLDVVVSGAGYRSTARVPAGYTDTQSLRFDMKPPPKAVIGQMCIRNAGKIPMSLNATNEFRTSGRPTLTIDGVPQPIDAQLLLYSKKSESYLSQLGAIFKHAATFTPPFLPSPVLALLALLALLCIPAGAFAALAIAARDDDDDA